MTLLLGVVIPTVLYVLAALLSVRKLLKKDTVLLLNGNADGGNKKGKRLMAGRKISFRTKFALRSLLGNPMRSFVVLLGVFLGCFIILLGWGFFDSIDHMGNTAAEEMGSYEHQYVLNEMLTENPYGGEAMLVSTVEDADGSNLSVPCVYAAAHGFFLMMVDYGVMLIDAYIEPKSYLISILLTAGCYFDSLWLLRRKVKRVDMIESLKDNRE